jgi:putative redox protein
MSTQAQLKWVAGLQFVARADDGPALVTDSGDDRSGPSPMQLVLMGVAGCTAMDVISIMQKKRAEVTRFEVTITGERAEEHPRRYTHIAIEYVLYGHDIPPQAVERAIELSETKYCSAIASLNARFEHSYRIVEDKR